MSPFGGNAPAGLHVPAHPQGQPTESDRRGKPWVDPLVVVAHPQ